MSGAAPDASSIEIINPTQWQGKPITERRWIVPEIVPEGNVTMLSGDGGVGKSLLGMQLLVSCALGKPWLGMSVRRCRVVGLFCEDDSEELHRRLAKILKSYGANFADLENLALLSGVGRDNLLMEFPDQWTPGKPTALLGRIQELAVERDAKLILLDSLHDLFGGNENARPQARQFIGSLRNMVLPLDGAILLTAHPSLSGRENRTGESGSTAWNNAVRSRLYLTSGGTKAAEYNCRYLRTQKSNYAAGGGEIKLRWSEGLFVPDGDAAGKQRPKDQHSTDEFFLDCLDRLSQQGRHVHDSRSQSIYAPKVIMGMPEAKGFKQADLADAMSRLFSAGKIRMAEEGPPSRRRKHMVRVTSTADGAGNQNS